MSESLRSNLEPTMSVKPMINVGALFDIPTGTYKIGIHGESILNGGLGSLTGVVGIGNNYKSTLTHYFSLSALSKIMSVAESTLDTYDTELNIHEDRLRQLARAFFKDRDIIDEGIWVATDNSVYSGNKWFEKLKEYLKMKMDNKKKFSVDYPFLDRDKKTLIHTLVPTFGEIDSLTEFVTEDVLKIQTENEIGESGGNTLHMRLGLAKTRMFMEMPTRIVPAAHYMVMTAQLGKDTVIQTGPIHTAPTVKLAYLKNNDKIKGVGDKFHFALSNLWNVYNVKPLINKSNGGEEYPLERDDIRAGSSNLNTVNVRQLRSKSGSTGYILEIVASQDEGILPTLTEFHYLKNMNRFGMGGNLTTFHMELYPEVTLTRPTIRSKINSDDKLCRAINITAELCQLIEYPGKIEKELLCTAKELFDDLKAKGYDWDMLLQTRGWWTVNNDTHPVPFLSTADLLRMRKDLYRPYWM